MIKRLLYILFMVGLSVATARAQAPSGHEGNRPLLPWVTTPPSFWRPTGTGWSIESRSVAPASLIPRAITPVNCATMAAPVVGYEISKGQLPTDATDFLNSLVAGGYRVGTVDLNTGSIPACVDILIVQGLAQNSTLTTPYTGGEGTLLKNWVSAGHGILISGDWGIFRAGTEALFQAYGYTQEGPSPANDPTDFETPSPPPLYSWVIYQADNFAPHPVLNGINSLEFLASSWLSPTTQALITTDADANPAGAAVMAAFGEGSGCVILSTDSNWNDNQGYPKQNNAQVARQAIGWLKDCSRLTLSKVATPTQIQAGQILTFTLKVSNTAAVLATNILITDTVPANTTLIAATSPYTQGGGSLTWPVGNLALGGSKTVTMVVQVATSVASGTVITNQGWVASQEGLTATAVTTALVFTRPVVAPTPSPTPPLTSTLTKTYLPIIVRTLPGFPLFVGSQIPVRPAAFPGEIFYATTLQVPAQLPAGGHFYFSSEPGRLRPVLVDDRLALLLNGSDHFVYSFSTPQRPPEPIIVEIPRSKMVQAAGQTIRVEYRDIYGVLIQATPLWIIWQP